MLNDAISSSREADLRAERRDYRSLNTASPVPTCRAVLHAEHAKIKDAAAVPPRKPHPLYAAKPTGALSGPATGADR